jgi:hypothetical protein
LAAFYGHKVVPAPRRNPFMDHSFAVSEVAIIQAVPSAET